MSWEVRHMKLKVCFCNKTVLKTDITRFAPVWASYLLGLAMMVLLQFSGGSDDTAKNSIVHDFNRLCMLGVGVNGLYALVVVPGPVRRPAEPQAVQCSARHARDPGRLLRCAPDCGGALCGGTQLPGAAAHLLAAAPAGASVALLTLLA